jgi:hypothetical protein
VVDHGPYPRLMPEWVKHHLLNVNGVSVLIAVAALVVSLLTLRRQTTQWREGGPLGSCAIYVGAMYPGGRVTGVPSAMVADALFPPDVVSPVVVLAVSGTGRLPIYLSSVRFETTHLFRDRDWRWWKAWRNRHSLTWIGVPVAGGDLYERIDAVQRKDFAFSWGPIKAIATTALEHGGPSTVRAVVVLGNGAEIRTGLLDMSSAPRGRLSQLTPDDQSPPTRP